MQTVDATIELNELFDRAVDVLGIPLSHEPAIYAGLQVDGPPCLSIDTVDGAAASSQSHADRILLPRDIADKLSNGWLQALVEVDDSSFGMLAHIPETRRLYEQVGAYTRAHIEMMSLPDIEQLRFQVATGISESEISIGGVARRTVLFSPLQFPVIAQDFETFANQRHRESKLAPKQVKRRSDLDKAHFLDKNGWDPPCFSFGDITTELHNHGEADLENFGFSLSKKRGTGVLLDELVRHSVDTLVTSTELRQDVKITEDVKESVHRNMSAGIHQLRELHVKEEATPVDGFLIDEFALKDLISIASEPGTQDFSALIYDNESSAYTLLLYGRFMCFVAPSPIEGKTWMNIAEIQK